MKQLPSYGLGNIRPRIDESAFVHETAVLIGDVRVEANASIWPHAVLRADYGSITIGEGSSVQDGTVVHPSREHATEIGSGCVIGHRAHMDGCVLEDFVLVGSGAVILEGSTLKRGAVVAAGALLLRGTQVSSDQRAQGVPASLVSNTTELDEIRAGSELYKRNAQRYLLEQIRIE